MPSFSSKQEKSFARIGGKDVDVEYLLPLYGISVFTYPRFNKYVQRWYTVVDFPVLGAPETINRFMNLFFLN